MPNDLGDRSGFWLSYSSVSGLGDSPNRGNGDKILVIRDTIESVGDNTYTWIGSLYTNGDLNSYYGSVIITFDYLSGLSGTFATKHGIWVVSPIGDNANVLVRVDQFKSFNYSRNIDEKSSNKNTRINYDILELLFNPHSNNNNKNRSFDVPNTSRPLQFYTEVRALVLWTTAAAADRPEVSTIASQSISEINDIYDHSGLTPFWGSSPRLVLAHKQLLSGFIETPYGGSMSGFNAASFDVDALTNNQFVKNLRNQYNADIVILLTKSGGYGGTLGVVQQIPTLPNGYDADNAYAIVDVSEAVSGETFSHEVSHLFGARHAPSQVVSSNMTGAPYGRAHFGRTGPWYDPARFITVTGNQSDPGDRRIRRISNPDIRYDDEPTGVEGYTDNARVIRNSASALATYRTSPITVSISQSGSSSYLTHTMHPSGGSGNRTYEWAISQGSPGNYQLVSTSQTWTYQFPSQTTYIKGTVYSGPGEIATAYRTITYTPPNACDAKPWLPECDGGARRGDQEVTANTSERGKVADIKLSQNPILDEGHVIYSLASSGSVRIAIYDTRGREVAVVVDGQREAGTFRSTIPIGSLSSGLYIIRMITGSDIISKPMTIIR